MGKPSLPEPALPFVAALFRDERGLFHAKERLEKVFGDLILEIPPLPWNYSSYYEDELGSPLKRSFFFFRDNGIQEELAGIKLATNSIEEQLSKEGKRSVNLDPGYLTRSKVVLASTKNYSHRIYLGRGIYAEVTLVYRDGRYRPHLFTYSDFATDEYSEILERARKLLP